MLRSTLKSELFPIVTPFKHWVWRDYLEDAGVLDQFADIPLGELDVVIQDMFSRFSTGIENGFFMGLENYKLAKSFIPPNHYNDPAHHEFLVKKYGEEITAHRLSPGYEPAFLESLIGRNSASVPSLANVYGRTY